MYFYYWFNFIKIHYFSKYYYSTIDIHSNQMNISSFFLYCLNIININLYFTLIFISSHYYYYYPYSNNYNLMDFIIIVIFTTTTIIKNISFNFKHLFLMYFY